MQSICQVAAYKAASAITSFVRAFGTTSSAARSKQTNRPPRTYQWRSIATVALLAGAFLLPAFAAQAQIATTTTITSSLNPSHVSDPVTFTATVTSNGNGAPDRECPIF